MDIKVKDIVIMSELAGARYLGSGASKYAYLKDDVVIKVPRGHDNIDTSTPFCIPANDDEYREFLEEVANYDNRLVWPLGQFAVELQVWNALTKLEKEGYDISGFARITDYYFDKNGVIIVEQEKATDSIYDQEEELEVNYVTQFIEDNETVLNALRSKYNIDLEDITSYNLGRSPSGKVKLFDFGISNGIIHNYGSYSNASYNYCDSDRCGYCSRSSCTDCSYN